MFIIANKFVSAIPLETLTDMRAVIRFKNVFPLILTDPSALICFELPGKAGEWVNKSCQFRYNTKIHNFGDLTSLVSVSLQCTFTFRSLMI